MPLRPALVLIAGFAVLSGCQASRLTPEAAARAAAEAESRGKAQEAAVLYRQAARGGNLDAAMVLAHMGREKRSLGDWLFDPRPSPDEAARWSRIAHRQAMRLVEAGDAHGHLVLANAAWIGPRVNSVVTPLTPERRAEARRHFDAAAALGDRNAIIGRAHFVWQTESLLAAEPLIREGAAAGIPEMATLLSVVVHSRPRLERGLRSRDVPGDLSLVDVVGSIRVLQEAGFPETTAEAEQKVAVLRAQARAGNADADSLLHALDA